MANKVLAVIPARLQSTRLPEKPLKKIRGKTLIQRVWERAKSAQSLNRVVVATDSAEIQREVTGFGGEVVMTRPELACGSERVLSAAQIISEPRKLEEMWDIIVNVQGDMPFLRPEVIDGLVGFLRERMSEFGMATIATPITDEGLFLSKSVVKVVVSARSEGLYFSRSPIPCPRGDEDRCKVRDARSGRLIHGYKHMGLYAFTPAGVRSYNSSDQSPLEQIERLEQLRVLERGEKVGVLLVDPQLTEPGVEVDTPADLSRAEEIADQLER